MSALDQAIIKAYAKIGSATAPGAAADGKTRASGGAVRARTIDQIYREGALYRVESHATVTPSANDVPPHHLPKLPPTSPRRSVRRSVLRMLAAQPNGIAVQATIEPPARIARKVIIRHISHGAAPRPLGMRPFSADPGFDRAELPPETISNEPAPSIPQNPLPTPVPMAPLNIAGQSIQSIDVCGDWEHESAVAPMVLVADVEMVSAPSMVVNVQLEALEAYDTIDSSFTLRDGSILPTSTSFAAKSLDDSDEPRVYVRLDAAHANGPERPHARFRNAHGDELQAADRNASVASSTDNLQNKSPAQDEIAADELTFADPPLDALASDLIPSTTESNPSQEADSAQPKPAVPVWEVDRFHWPRTVERLFGHEQGYLSSAGEKLQAAMQDGLKVLAITGSRRGEGRSTLALCLARAAAQTGVQVAVMDADFARPQLASKIGLDIAHGWQEAAIGKIPLSEAAVKSVADSITLLPLESSAPTRALSLADPRVTATIRAAAATFDLLILDLGPMAAGESIGFPAGELSPFDAAIVVRDLRFATAAESESIGHSLQDAGVEAVGIAENFVIDDESPASSH